MWEFLQKLKQLQPESKNIVLTGLTGEVLGEKALVSEWKAGMGICCRGIF